MPSPKRMHGRGGGEDDKCPLPFPADDPSKIIPFRHPRVGTSYTYSRGRGRLRLVRAPRWWCRVGELPRRPIRPARQYAVRRVESPTHFDRRTRQMMRVLISSSRCKMAALMVAMAGIYGFSTPNVCWEAGRQVGVDYIVPDLLPTLTSQLLRSWRGAVGVQSPFLLATLGPKPLCAETNVAQLAEGFLHLTPLL